MTTKVKNDRSTYRKREVAAPKGRIVHREGASDLFFSAPVNGFYLDFRPDAKSKPNKKG